MRHEPNQLEDPAYTTSRGRRYNYWKENRMAYDLIKDNLLWEFQAYRGDDKFPRTQVLTLSGANEINRVEALKFAARLNGKEGVRLWQWHMINPIRYYTSRRMLMDGWIAMGISKDEDEVRGAIDKFNKLRAWTR